MYKRQQEGLTELKAEREQLVQDIANAELPVTLKREDVERIEALRERVKALEAVSYTHLQPAQSVGIPVFRFKYNHGL